MNLIIDQGNTRTKLAIFKEANLVRTKGVKVASPQVLKNFLGADQPLQAIFSKVGPDHQLERLQSHFNFPIYELGVHRPLPFKLKYKTPETLGLDRIALAAAAAHDYPGKNCLVIDAGTCLTYDFIDRERNYHGGAIAPGLKMRYQALHHFTARLPLVAHRAEVELIGDSTETSIQAGVAGGIFYEVKATIEAYQMRYPGLITVLTGGDYAAFEGLSKNGIFAAPEFLLHGLNNILEYYAEVL